jgi:alkylation response protein AidB-like acyl-CoA dehydrogenase
VDLAVSEEQQQLVASFAGLLQRASSPDHVRAAEPTGFDPALWRALVDLGAVTMAAPDARGGWGATLLDLALVAEQLGRALAPAPVIESQVAARLLASVGSVPALEALTPLLTGERIISLALHPVRHGVAALAPAGAVSDDLVVLDADRLVLEPTPGGARQPISNLGAAPLADVTLHGGTDLASGPEALDRFQVALDEWLLLTAAALVGMGAAAHEEVCRYAAERRAFGGVIGGYQGVAHPLADDATNLDGARLLVHKAAWALDAGESRGRELAAMAFAFASETAERSTYHAIHFHGGYGFMLEHDAQLFYRRARTWARVWGDAEDGYRRAAWARYGSVPAGAG